MYFHFGVIIDIAEKCEDASRGGPRGLITLEGDGVTHEAEGLLLRGAPLMSRFPGLIMIWPFWYQSVQPGVFWRQNLVHSNLSLAKIFFQISVVITESDSKSDSV